MAIGAKEPEVIELVIPPITVDMIYLKYDRTTTPLHDMALFTFVLDTGVHQRST